ncbi:hypothetical protein [Metapseudomonas furukawaii]
MKLSNDFDPRRLRPRRRGSWRWRFAAALAALIAGFGILLAMAGAATLLGRPPALGALNESTGAAIVLLLFGLLFLWVGILAWRFSRRRALRRNDLSMSPHLMKKRN